MYIRPPSRAFRLRDIRLVAQPFVSPVSEVELEILVFARRQPSNLQCHNYINKQVSSSEIAKLNANVLHVLQLRLQRGQCHHTHSVWTDTIITARLSHDVP